MSERGLSFVYIYKRTQARSSALLKFQVFWSDVLFQRSPADFLLKAHGTYSRNSLERESNQILRISDKKRAPFDAFEFAHRSTVCLNFANKNTKIPSRLIMPQPRFNNSGLMVVNGPKILSRRQRVRPHSPCRLNFCGLRATSMLCFICNYLLLAYWHRAYARLCATQPCASHFGRRDSLSVSLVLHFNSQRRRLFWCFFLQSTMIN